MMRTRCPACHSVFRVTPEQTRMKAGKVRCGHCHQVFNALDNLLEDPVATVPSGASAADVPASPDASVEIRPAAAAGAEPPGGASQPAIPLARHPENDAPLESARDAGLVAARELSDTPAFNRWAAGTMAGDGSIGLDVPARPRRLAWRVLALLLLVVLAGQAVFYFRADIVAREPRIAPLFAMLEIDVPRPAHGELVAVESTELHANVAGPGLLLDVTLKNRAPYVQAWPSLELTLTDANDQLLVRRIFTPAEYLSAERLAAGFPAHGEVGVKLVLDAGEMPAAGYGLYAFYP